MEIAAFLIGVCRRFDLPPTADFLRGMCITRFHAQAVQKNLCILTKQRIAKINRIGEQKGPRPKPMVCHRIRKREGILSIGERVRAVQAQVFPKDARLSHRTLHGQFHGIPCAVARNAHILCRTCLLYTSNFLFVLSGCTASRRDEQWLDNAKALFRLSRPLDGPS